jgi:hypothetical protein
MVWCVRGDWWGATAVAYKNSSAPEAHNRTTQKVSDFNLLTPPDQKNPHAIYIEKFVSMNGCHESFLFLFYCAEKWLDIFLLFFSCLFVPQY